MEYSGKNTGVGCHFLLQGISLIRDPNHMSCIVRRILGHCAIWEAYIGAQFIKNVLVSGVQQSDSVAHIHVFIIFQIIFLFRLLQNIEQISSCYTIGPYWLSVLSILDI